MTHSRILPAQVLVMVAVLLLAAGCVMDAGDGKSSGNAITHNVILSKTANPIHTVQISTGANPVSENFSTNAITPASLSKPPKNNISSWITVDPVSDQYLWDSPTITGHTNLDPGSILSVQIYEQIHTCPLGLDCKFWSSSGNASVVAGNRGNNTWSYPVNLSGTHPNDDYIISVRANDPTIYGGTKFRVKTGPQPSAREHDLTDTVVRGESFTFNDSFPSPEVRIWLFGKNTINITVEPIDSNGFFAVHMNRSSTTALSAGTYKMLLQFPGEKGFDITTKNGTSRFMSKTGEVFLDPVWVDNGILTGFSALNNLKQKLDEPDVADKYLTITLNVMNP